MFVKPQAARVENEHESSESNEYKLSKKRKLKSPQGSFVSFEILLPVGQWVYDKSRVRKTASNSWLQKLTYYQLNSLQL